jgi:hypothetical protein
MYLICLELTDEGAVQVNGHSYDIFPAVHQDLPGNRKETYLKRRTQEMLWSPQLLIDTKPFSSALTFKELFFICVSGWLNYDGKSDE